MSNFSLDLSAVWAALTSHAKELGVFERVNGHEARNTPGHGLSCDLMLGPLRPVPQQSGLATASAQLIFQARVYNPALKGPLDGLDQAVLRATGLLMGEYSGAFTLGGVVESVDVLGRHGTPLSAVPGWLDVAAVKYRVMTITVPLVINDVWNEVA